MAGRQTPGRARDPRRYPSPSLPRQPTSVMGVSITRPGPNFWSSPLVICATRRGMATRVRPPRHGPRAHTHVRPHALRIARRKAPPAPQGLPQTAASPCRRPGTLRPGQWGGGRGSGQVRRNYFKQPAACPPAACPPSSLPLRSRRAARRMARGVVTTRTRDPHLLAEDVDRVVPGHLLVHRGVQRVAHAHLPDRGPRSSAQAPRPLLERLGPSVGPIAPIPAARTSPGVEDANALSACPAPA